MEFAEGGGMFDHLNKLGNFTLKESAQYFYETCDALEYLHTLPDKVIHRDIKPENILLDKGRRVKLADFGWSNVMQGLGSRATFCGTPDYLAPEMIRGDGHNESLDMWEMGVLLYEMILGKSPFGASTQDQTCRKILRCDLRFPADMDPDGRACIQCLCKVNPDERLTAKQAKGHDFVKKYHLGFSTDVVCPAVDPAAYARLQGEVKCMLQAKSKLEQQMLDMTMELEQVYKLLHQEKTRADNAEDCSRRKEMRRKRDNYSTRVVESPV
jgi:serine/threonine protein kinase